MITSEQFIDKVLDIALDGELEPDDANTRVRALWVAGLALAAAALRRTDRFTCERLLRNVERELRYDLAALAHRNVDARKLN